MIRAWYERIPPLYLFAIGASFLFSFIIATQIDTINPDGICYVLSASAVGKMGISSAVQLCGQAHWPFYSIILYYFSHVSHLFLPNAAYVLNSIFTVISVLSFILITKELGGTQRTLWLAAFVILCAHEFNVVRSYIIRDHGFWAFYLTSIYFLLRYFNQQKWIYCLLANASLLLAGFFRIEGLLFLASVPFLFFFYSAFNWRKRCTSFLLMHSLSISLAIFFCVWFLWHPQGVLAHTSRLAEIFEQYRDFISSTRARFAEIDSILSQSILGPYAKHDASLVFILTLIGWYGVSVINNLSLIYTCLLVYAWKQKSLLLNSSGKLVLYTYLILNIFITFVFLVENLFLSKRYLIALTLVLMLYVPFALNDLLKRQRFVIVGIIAFLMSVSAASSLLNFNHSKMYMRHAGAWLANYLPPNANVFMNDNVVMYYSGHYGDSIFDQYERFTENPLTVAQLKYYNYVVLRSNKRDNPLSTTLTPYLTLVKQFNNEHDDGIFIYSVDAKANKHFRQGKHRR